MAISSSERRTKNVQVFVEKDAVETSFAKWAQPGHFSRTLAKGPKTTTWIWNLHADAHDFDSQTSSLEEVSRKIFSAHFGQLAIIFLWISGMHFHGAYFSNYSAWLNDPIGIKQSSQVVWPIVGQEILNGDVGGNFQGVQTTSGWFHYHKAAPKLEWFQNAESMMTPTNEATKQHQQQHQPKEKTSCVFKSLL
jgi:photosystem I P700 chlorophyll a apoprotein A1